MLSEEKIKKVLSSPEVMLYLKKNGIKHISLFGSFAVGEQTPDSDVDILYEQDKEKQLGWEIVDIIEFLSGKLHASIDFVEKNSLHERVKAKVLSSEKKIF